MCEYVLYLKLILVYLFDKGLKIGKMPHVLTFQMKRFVYDFSSGDVVQMKLNDEVRFPMFLDMNKYVSKKTVSSSMEYGSEKAGASSQSEFDSSLMSEIAQLQRDRSEGKLSALANQCTKSDVPIDVDDDDDDLPPLAAPSDDTFDHDFYGQQDDEDCNYNDGTSKNCWFDHYEKGPISTPTEVNIEDDSGPGIGEVLTLEAALAEVEANGEWVYELFAVLVHSGAIYGGHYYAYIKDMDSGKWLDFNDSTVTEIEESSVRETWGGKIKSSFSSYGSSSRYTSSYQSSTNAYMLQYRKVSPKRNVPGSPASQAAMSLPGAEMVPAYIAEAVELVEWEKKTKEQSAQERLNQLPLKVTWNGVEYPIKASRKDSLRCFMVQICKELKLTAGILSGRESSLEEKTNPELTDEDCENMSMKFLRLRGTKPNTEVYSITDDADMTLEQHRIYLNKSFLLETKKEDEIWEPYNQSDCDLVCYEYDELTAEFKTPRSIRVSKHILVEDARRQISKWVDYDISEIFLLKLTTEHGQNVRVEEILHDTLSLNLYVNLTYYWPCELFWERRLATDKSSPLDCKCRQVSSTFLATVYDPFCSVLDRSY